MPNPMCPPVVAAPAAKPSKSANRISGRFKTAQKYVSKEVRGKRKDTLRRLKERKERGAARMARLMSDEIEDEPVKRKKKKSLNVKGDQWNFEKVGMITREEEKEYERAGGARAVREAITQAFGTKAEKERVLGGLAALSAAPAGGFLGVSATPVAATPVLPSLGVAAPTEGVRTLVARKKVAPVPA